MKKNNHYIPQFYLDGFTENPGSKKIWLHRLETEESRRTQIKSIANENNLYPDHVEKFLAEEIEGPVREIIKSIVLREAITSYQKYLLSIYMVIQWKRVPVHKEIFLNQLAPGLFEEQKERIHTEFEELIQTDPENQDFYLSNLQKFDDIYQDEAKKQQILKEVWENSFNPQDATPMINAIRSMTWSYLVSPTTSFLTNDNPFYFTQEIGMRRDNSEISFPLTSTIALWITNRSELKEGAYYKATPKGIDIINLRTIINAYKYVYSCKQSDWIYYLRKLHRPEGERK